MDTLFATWRARRPWILEQQIQIARIASPTGNESARAAQLQLMWAAHGDIVARDEVGNISTRIAPMRERDADAPSIVCLAHLDTVFESDTPLTVAREGSRVMCPGIGDNGRGLAAMLVLARALRSTAVRAQLRRPIDLVLTVGEEGEGNLRGSRHWFDMASRRATLPMAAIAIDGPGDHTIVHHAVGSDRLRITMQGHGGHSWANSDTPNPVHAAGACIARLAQLGASARPFGVVTVSRMHGGEHLTGVPTQAWIDVDIRSLNADRLRALRREVEQIARDVVRAESAHRHDLALTTTFRSLGHRPAGEIDATHPLVQTAMAATTVVGRTPRSASASTDANIPLARGIPAIAIGAGGTGSATHTRDEWYDDTDSDIGMERALRLVIALSSMHHTSDWSR